MPIYGYMDHVPFDSGTSEQLNRLSAMFLWKLRAATEVLIDVEPICLWVNQFLG